MTRELFTSTINFILDKSSKQEHFIDTLEMLAPGNYCDCFLYAEYEALVIRLLETYYGNNTLSWWLYETECGKQYNTFIENGKDITINTLDELYDYLEAHRNGK